MKITIDARGKEVEALAKAGLLKGARVLERKAAKRRQLSKQTEEVLIMRLDQLRGYKLQFGSFDVPRIGQYSELGDWLDKLRETYVKAPDGYRIHYLREHAPDLLAYLSNWAKTKVTKATVRNAPFWLSASWVADFMEVKLNAPSQASIHPDEVAMAKWLSRWTSTDAIEKLRREPGAYEVAAELAELAQMLRSRDRNLVDQARESVRSWRDGKLYRTLVSMCVVDEDWLTAKRRREFDRCVETGERFWPTWTEWKREAAVWVTKAAGA